MTTSPSGMTAPAPDSRGRASSALSDLGLVVLRVAIGSTMLAAGLGKALDFGSTAASMESSGWRQPTFAAFMITAAEAGGGIALLLGLLTPLAACAVIAAMLDAWAVTVSSAAFWSEPFNVPFLTVFVATALLCTGAGAHSIDARAFGRARWPAAVTAVLFVVAVAAAVATWVLLNGVNPIHLTDPAA